jgi:hypothetical protein
MQTSPHVDRYQAADAVVEELKTAIERAARNATSPQEKAELRTAGEGALQRARTAFFNGDPPGARAALSDFRARATELATKRGAFERAEAARLEQAELRWREMRAGELFRQFVASGLEFRLQPDGQIRVRGSKAGDLTDAELADARRCAKELRGAILEHLARERQEVELLPADDDTTN